MAIGDKIKKIVGEASYARLKKQKLHTATAIKNTPPGKIMSIAGIGPVKAEELYTTLGVKLSEKQAKRTYNKLKSRTLLSRIKSGTRKRLENPKEVISNIEGKRQELLLWQNLLANVRNIGRREDRTGRIEPETYAPVSTTIDPFSISSSISKRDKVFAELFIETQDDRVLLKYDIISTQDNEKISSLSNTISGQTSTEIATGILQMIRDIFTGYRQRTLIGDFVIIVAPNLTYIYEAIEDAFRRDIERRIMILVPGKQNYYTWEALFKYDQNEVFNNMVELYDDYSKFVEYDKYLREGGKDNFDNWKKNAPDGFWESTKELLISYHKLDLQRGEMRFGVIQGMPGMFDYEQEGRVVQTMGVNREKVTNIKEYMASRLEPPMSLGSVNIPMPVINLAELIFLGYDVYQYKNSIILRSKELPEIGVVFTIGG